MLLGELRRCEVLGLRLSDVDLADRRVTITEGKGGHHRIVPVAPGFFTALAAYLDTERPTDTATASVFVVLKGPRRGQPLSVAGVDEIIRGARGGARIDHLTCHMLRHTCLTRLREAGMSLRWSQAQPSPQHRIHPYLPAPFQHLARRPIPPGDHRPGPIPGHRGRRRRPRVNALTAATAQTPASAARVADSVLLDEPTAITRFATSGDSPAAHMKRQATVEAFTRAFTDLSGWQQSPLATQLAISVEVR